MKVLLFVLAISFVLTQEDKRPLIDLNKMYEQGTLLKFLEDTKVGGYPVSVEDCMENPIFKPTKKVVDPPEIIKGEDIHFKVGGIMTVEQTVSKLHLDTYFNGSVIFTDNVDKKNQTVPKGLYSYDYTASVPAFTPSGKWEIFIYLINSNGEKISCTKALFNTE